jgi:hypothetical protein
MKIIFLLLLIPMMHYAQNQSYNDQLYLHNGSVLKGKLIQFSTTDTVIFALSETEIIHFQSKIVKKVKMAVNEVEIYKFRSQAWYVRSQISMLYSKVNSGISLNLSGGYQFNHWLAAGIGGGIDNYYTTAGHNMYPVFGEIRTSFFKKNKTPYFAVRTGYGFVSADEAQGQNYAKGSWMFNPVFGYRLGGGKPNIDLFAGVRFQSARYITTDSWSTAERDIDFRRYDFGVGLIF